MSTSVRLSLAAGLALGSLALHRLVYEVSGSEVAPGHGYLATVLPMVLAVALAVALSAILLRGTGGHSHQPAPRLSPLPVAAGLAAIFGVQETLELILTGGGAGAIGDSLSVAGPMPALVLLVAAAIVAIVVWLDRVGSRLALVVGRSVEVASSRPTRSPVPQAPILFALRILPMAFGLARRPPPLTA